MFSKSLLHNDFEFNNLRSSYENLPEVAGYRKGEHIGWYLGQPVRYPCICCYEKHYNDNGADYYDGDYVYIDDFEGLIVDPRTKMEDE